MRESERVASILAEWQERIERGQAASPEDAIAAHPDLAEELRARFAALRLIDAALPPARGPQAIGDFRIVREIGRGGMGVVYEAEQLSMRRRVALKVLAASFGAAPQAVKRFEREAQAAGRLHHTNIVPVYAMGRHEGHWYYAMDLVQGRPLSDVVAELRAQAGGRPTEETLAGQGPRTPPTSLTDTGDRSYFARVADLFAGVADALHLAHTEGIVHRDVKPSNLLLDADGVLKIVDFGLARTDGASMTITGDLLGTPAYMSPEQAMAKRIKLDHRTDVYSLGATLYEVLTFRPPFEGSTLHEICLEIITKDPALPRRRNRRIPRDLETVVLKAMEKDRDRRYRTAGELARDLRRFADGAAIHARRIGPVGRAWRKTRRHKVRAALVLGVLLAGAAATALGLLAREEAERARLLEYARLCADAEEAAARQRPAPIDEPGLEAGADASEADGIYARAIALRPEGFEAYFGRALLPRGEIATRLENLDGALERGLPERTGRLARAYVLASRGRHEDAPALRAEGGEDPAALYFEAYLLDWAGDRRGAEPLLDRILGGPGGGLLRYRAHRTRARLRMRTGENAAALEDLHGARALGGDGPEVSIPIGIAMERLGQRAAAEAIFEEALGGARGAGAVAAWLELVDACGDHARWHLRAAEEAVAAFPDALPLLRRLVRRLEEQGSHERALETIDRALLRNPGTAELHLARARALGGLGRTGDALAAFDRALRIDPSLVEARLARGGLYADALRRLEEALADFDRVVEIDPGCAPGHENRGLVLGELGRREEALAALDRAVQLRPTDWRAWGNRAVALGRLGRTEEALASLDVLAARAQDPSALLWCGSALKQLGRPGEAMACYDAALRMRPDARDTALNRAVLMHDAGQPAEALAEYERLLEGEDRPRRRAELLQNRGNSLRQLDRHTEAVESFDLALALDPALVVAHINRAYALRDAGEGEKAVSQLRDALGSRPDPRLCNTLGCICDDLGRREEARAAYDEGIALDRLHAPLFANRGYLLKEEGKTAEAEADLRRAIELDPSLPEPRATLGLLLIGQQRYDDALAQLDEAARIAPQHAGIQCDRGVALFRLERNDDAVAAFRTALASDPGHAKSRDALAEALRHVWRHDEAVAQWKTLSETPGWAARAWTSIGFTHQGARGHEEAEAAFGRAVEADPGHFVARYQLGVERIALGRHEEALAALEEARKLRPSDLWVHARRGDALRGLGRIGEAATAYALALDAPGGGRDRGYCRYWRAWCLCELQRFDEALAALHDLSDAAAEALLAFALASLGRFDDAEEPLAKAWADDPAYPAVLSFRVRTLCLMGRFEEALEAARRLGNPVLVVRCLRALGRADEAKEAAAARDDEGLVGAYLWAAAGRTGRARELLAAEKPCAHPFCHADHARVLAVLGDREQALDALEKAVAAGLRWPANMAPDPDFAPLQGDPRYGALLARMRKPRAE